MNEDIALMCLHVLPAGDSHVHVFVELCDKVARHLPAAVVVAVVLGDVPAQVLHDLQEASVEQHGPVEGIAPRLDGTHTGRWVHGAPPTGYERIKHGCCLPTEGELFSTHKWTVP